MRLSVHACVQAHSKAQTHAHTYTIFLLNCKAVLTISQVKDILTFDRFQIITTTNNYFWGGAVGEIYSEAALSGAKSMVLQNHSDKTSISFTEVTFNIHLTFTSNSKIVSFLYDSLQLRN